MKLISSVFENRGTVPVKYTCDGENINPPLTITEVPTGIVSLTLIMDDPDAPMGTWDHWIVFDIPPETTAVFENQNPPGRMGKNTRGVLAYGGPCPPDREHRYFFKLYALDIMLDLPEGATKAEVEAVMEGHIVAQAELMGRYDRSK